MATKAPESVPSPISLYSIGVLDFLAISGARDINDLLPEIKMYVAIPNIAAAPVYRRCQRLNRFIRT